MKKVNKENDFKITSIFTEKELAELNFTEEEIADIEAAEAATQAFDILPESEKEMDEFFAKFETLVTADKDPAVIYHKFMDLANTDPTFQAQILAMTILIDSVDEVPEPKSEKVSLADIEKEKESQLSEDRKEKLAKFDAILKSMK